MAEIIFEGLREPMLEALKTNCEKYEGSEYSVKKFYDGIEMKGFCIYHDENGIRYIDEAHYIGKDRFIFLKMWWFIRKDAKIFRLAVQKFNKCMVDLYMRHGFKIVGEDVGNFYLQRGE